MFCPKCRTEYRKGFTKCVTCEISLVNALPPAVSDALVIKKRARHRLFFGFLIAPLFAPLTMCLITFFSDAPFSYMLKTWIAPTRKLIIFFNEIMFYGSVIGYVFMIILGFPLYFIFNRFNRINYWTLSIGGALIAALPFVLLGLSKDAKEILDNYTVYLALATCGLAVGNAFYFIVHWNPSGHLTHREARNNTPPLMSDLNRRINWSIYTLALVVSSSIFGALAVSDVLPVLGGSAWFWITLIAGGITGLVVNYVRPRYENTAGLCKSFYDFLLKQLPASD